MIKFSANLGFLWKDLPLPDAIRAAKVAGFDAVECHWPYEFPASEVIAALDETGLPMLGLNTAPGNLADGDFGLSAIPGREREARAAIDKAIESAAAVKARNVHVMAGKSKGEIARSVFVENLSYACEAAKKADLTILIEPLNAHDATEYFLKNVEQAIGIIDEVASSNLKLMFDCYHVGRTECGVIETLTKVFPYVGHIQFASVPDRGPPDRGKVNYADVFQAIQKMGWSQPLGAEYKPDADTASSLGWMKTLF